VFAVGGGDWDLLVEKELLYQELDKVNLRGLSTANLRGEVSGLRSKQERL
jgi:hypothetical protein